MEAQIGEWIARNASGAVIILMTSLIPLFLGWVFNIQSEPPTERVRHCWWLTDMWTMMLDVAAAYGEIADSEREWKGRYPPQIRQFAVGIYNL